MPQRSVDSSKKQGLNSMIGKTCYTKQAILERVKVLLSRCLAVAIAAVLVLFSAHAAEAARGAAEVKGEYIVVLEGSAGSTDATTDGLQRKRGFRARLRFRRALRGFAARLSDQQVAQLRHDPAVASVTPDRPVKALRETRLAAGDMAPTGVRRVGAANPGSAREESSANVAVLNNGSDQNHP